jgi:hypothetical protein
MEALRRRKPAPNLLCAKCRKSLVVFEVTEMREIELGRAANRRR